MPPRELASSLSSGPSRRREPLVPEGRRRPTDRPRHRLPPAQNSTCCSQATTIEGKMPVRLWHIPPSSRGSFVNIASAHAHSSSYRRPILMTGIRCSITLYYIHHAKPLCRRFDRLHWKETLMQKPLYPLEKYCNFSKYTTPYQVLFKTSI